LRIKQGDLDIFRPQLAYLEQLVFMRYRLSLDNINKMSSDELKERILKKDENLKKRGTFNKITGGKTKPPGKDLAKDGNGAVTQEAIINAIFGNNNFRRDGEKNVTRTITITISDEVKD